MTYLSGLAAVARAESQSKHGPRFGTGQCKQRVRELFNVPSDGAGTASIAWSRTKHRIPYSVDMPVGTLIWWTGGSPTKNHRDGAGHVVVYVGGGMVWSTDVKRNGYFDLVPFERIGKWAPRLKFAGCSLDIEGVQVIPTPSPRPRPDDPKPTLTTPEDPMAALLAELRAVCKKYGVSRVYGARVLLKSAAKDSAGPYLERIDAGRKPLFGVDDPKKK